MKISVPKLIRWAIAAALRPDKDQLVSEWADEFRHLYHGAEPGQWRTSRVPFQREPMDRLSPSDPIRRVAMMKGSRVAATESGLNWIGYSIHRAPGPFIMSEPTEDLASRVSKVKLAPMLANTPVLRERVAEPRAKDTSNTILYKEFDFGSLTLIGMNSGNPLREADARYLYLDEVDGYPGEIKGEGNPVRLLERRTKTFGYRAKIFLTSTPKRRDDSRIFAEFRRGDQRRYFIPCPNCGHPDFLTWDGVDRVSSVPGMHHRIDFENKDPKTARMICSSCGAAAGESDKQWMIERGEWRATCEAADPETTSYHISSLYSPWETWVSIASDFLQAKDDPVELMVFVNTVLGEPWEDRSQEVGPDELKMRRETYPAQIPNGVGILCCSVDVQKDRLEAVVWGFGAREESWVIEWRPFHGETSLRPVYNELDRFLRSSFETESGRKVKIERVTIDSNYESNRVYAFCRARERRVLEGGWVQRVFAVRGGNELGKPVISQRPSRVNVYRALLFTICTDTAKDMIFSRLRVGRPETIGVPAPGYIHFGAFLDDEFFEQLMGETKEREVVGRRIRRVYHKIRDRNEALDLAVYAHAALYTGGPDLLKELPARAERWAKLPEKKEGGADPTPTRGRPGPQFQRPRKRGWISSVRDG